MGYKSVKDPVHGYISIPTDYVEKFIDTPIFQRLRNIEQTSMRCLFPGAHHDRFIHSLGVFHLGKEMYNALLDNSTDDVHEILKNPSLKNTFLIACLMHDCGHAPFSHTLEGFYNKNKKGDKDKRLFIKLNKDFPSGDFSPEGSNPNFHPADHEAMGAIILKECYSAALKFFECDIELAARMITGCRFGDIADNDLEKQVQNVLISLLNGNAIDVDKLDYIIRDAWASGVKNHAVDVHRLIRSAKIAKTKGVLRLVYGKSALSVIQSVVDARNYLYEWIYNHHTVKYFAEMLRLAVLKLGKRLTEDDGGKDPLAQLFSVEMFKRKISLRKDGSGPYAYQISDGDILLFLKLFCPNDRCYQSYASHKPNHFPLWKTEAEYRALFGTDAYQIRPKELESKLRKIFKTKPKDILFIDGEANRYFLQERDILIDFGGNKYMEFTKVVENTTEKNNDKDVPFFYLFIDNKYKSQKDEIIQALVKVAQNQ